MYGFRIHFHAPPGFALEPSEQVLRLPGAPEPVSVKQLPPRADSLPTDVCVLAADASGFTTQTDAREFGTALRRSLAVCSARSRFGFDLGQDNITASVGAAVREQIRRQTGQDIRPTVHGLDVFDATIPFQRIEIHARGSIRRAIKDLGAVLAADFPCPALPPKIALAVDLYNGIAHETDTEVRFLALVTVVEAMAVRVRVSPGAQEFVDACASLAKKTALGSTEREWLQSGLGNLRSESISRACARLVNDAGCAAELFKQAYKARSELLHDGVSRTYP
jgi:hypothetical protein